MKYALCIKPDDKNLLHIVEKSELVSPLYGAYQVVATAKNEFAAIEMTADFVQRFCDTGAVLKPDSFKAWILGERQ